MPAHEDAYYLSQSDGSLGHPLARMEREDIGSGGGGIFDSLERRWVFRRSNHNLTQLKWGCKPHNYDGTKKPGKVAGACFVGLT